MSGPGQRDMEQPWPPPGPWSFPRTVGEAEEESDLDVSPSSSHCPPVPGGGAQVRAACVPGGRGAEGRRANVRGQRGGPGGQRRQRLPRERGWPRAFPPRSPRPRTLARSSLPLGRPPLTFARGPPSSSLSGRRRDSRGAARAVQLDFYSPPRTCFFFDPSLYSELQLLCAELIGTVSDCTWIIGHRVLTSTSHVLFSHADISAESLSLASDVGTHLPFTQSPVPYCKNRFGPPQPPVKRNSHRSGFSFAVLPQSLILLVVFYPAFLPQKLPGVICRLVFLGVLTYITCHDFSPACVLN